jgi:GTPase Era involved in 16S rRNA processing
MLDCPVYLDLFVRVREDWRNRQSILNDLGYHG